CQPEVCGDGVVQAWRGELCDDGNLTDGDGCSSTCAPNVCGNGIVESGEQCDDGNTVGADGCSGNCSSTEVCGNRILDTAIPIAFHGATVTGLFVDYAAGGLDTSGTLSLQL